MQLIIVVEADKISKTDYIYINKYLNRFFVIGNDDKISPVYMGGKDNYKARRVEIEIERLSRNYRAQHEKNGLSIVLLCVDTDDLACGVDAKENESKMSEIVNYCKLNDYEIVWFCRDTEEVFLNRRVTKKEKKLLAERFKNTDLDKLNIENLRMADYGICKAGTSNLDLVLNKYLLRK